MNVVIPMAGRGQRFVDAGYSEPKPLIRVSGRPMYAWAVESLPLHLAQRLVFVCLAEHLRGHTLESDIRARFGELDPAIVPVDGVTDGQACTVLLADELIDTPDPLLVYNADTWCRTTVGERLARSPSVDGIVGVFEADGEHWSFARTDGSDRVVETAEKRRISHWAMTGLYHFARGQDFAKHARAMIDADERVNGEFYVAPVYNRLIQAGADIRIDVATEVRPLGTPEELASFVPPPDG